MDKERTHGCDHGGSRTDDLADFFKMFADSTRIRIMLALIEKETAVQLLSESLDMSMSAVSHQLRSLRQSKLVKSRRDGKTVFYSLDDDHVKHILETALEHMEERS
jgi:ArsR family transcriptional regulator